MKSDFKKTERNTTIANRIIRGERLKDVASDYGLSLERARQILHKYCENKDKNAYFEALAETRKFGWAKMPSLNILRKKWIHFIDKVKKNDLKQLSINFPDKKDRHTFMRKLKKLVYIGQHKSYVTWYEIGDLIPNDSQLYDTGLVTTEYIDKLFQMLERLGIVIIDKDLKEAFEELINNNRGVLKFPGHKKKFLLQLIERGRIRGYITEKELIDDALNEYKDELNNIFEKMNIQVVDETSKKDFEEKKIISFAAFNLPDDDKKILKHLINISKQRGYITYHELKDIFASENIPELIKMFEKLNLKVINEESNRD